MPSREPVVAVHQFDTPTGRQAVERVLAALALTPRKLLAESGKRAEQEQAVRRILNDVVERGDAAVVDASRAFDDPAFTADRLVVTAAETAAAFGRVELDVRNALLYAVGQQVDYQQQIAPESLDIGCTEGGKKLGIRFTPVDTTGCYFPGGKAAYPSSLIHLTVPAKVAGVRRVAAATPPSKYGASDLVLAAAHAISEAVGPVELYRAGGAAAIAALALGTQSIPAVDLIVGPGNDYVQIAKRLLSGAVGVDGYLGPSEVVVIADETADAALVAADLIAQAEHDPGSCFLLTTSAALAEGVAAELARQLEERGRAEAILRALANDSAVIVLPDLEAVIELADRFAGEHVNITTADDEAVLAKLRHAGAVFLGRHSPVAAGDYVAGPSHCLPTNTTARFTSGVSVYTFLKRTSVVRYTQEGIEADAPYTATLAEAEGLDAHAASALLRTSRTR
ncbi:MAG: histidinol dehydrogenase [Phycisphaerae bacterium]